MERPINCAPLSPVLLIPSVLTQANWWYPSTATLISMYQIIGASDRMSIHSHRVALHRWGKLRILYYAGAVRQLPSEKSVGIIKYSKRNCQHQSPVAFLTKISRSVHCERESDDCLASLSELLPTNENSPVQITTKELACIEMHRTYANDTSPVSLL